MGRDRGWKGVSLELLSRLTAFFAPAARALGTPPAMMLPRHHLDNYYLLAINHEAYYRGLYKGCC